jgi:rhodanese-related sulfurtransferase
MELERASPEHTTSSITAITIPTPAPCTAKRNIETGSSTLLDVRTDVEFAEQNVPDSKYIALDRLAGDAKAAAGVLWSLRDLRVGIG